MRTAVSFFLLILVGCASTRGSECKSHGGSEWFQLTTPHFRVRTNMDREAARAVAVELEQLRRAVHLPWSEHPDPHSRLDVALFRELAEYEEFGCVDSIGCFLDSPPWIVAAANVRGAELRKVLLHELSHYVSAHILLRQPRWLNEGMARSLETTEVQDGGRTVVIGKTGWRDYQGINIAAVDGLQTLLKWSNESLRPTELSRRYESSWAWVVFLRNKHPDRFLEYQKHLMRGAEPLAAWNTVFGPQAAEQMDKPMRAFFNGGENVVSTYSIEAENAGILEEHTMSAAEVHDLRAQLFLASMTGRTRKENEVRAQHEAKLASAVAADHPLAKLWSARFAPKESRVALATQLTTQLPKDARAWKLLANILAQEPSPERRMERLAALKHTMALSPDDGEAVRDLAGMLATDGRAQEALPIAEHAHRLRPWDATHAYVHAWVLGALGRCSEAAAVQSQAMELVSHHGATWADRYALALGIYQKCAQSPEGTRDAEIETVPDNENPGIPPEAIKAVVSREAGAIDACFGALLEANETATGHVTIHFALSREGRVTGAKLESKDIMDATFSRCIRQSVLGWKFPAPERGSPVGLRYSFVFSRTN